MSKKRKQSSTFKERITGHDKINLTDCKFLTPDNFYEFPGESLDKLIEMFNRFGNFMVFHAWIDGKGITYILDDRGRIESAFKEMINRGLPVPEEVNIALINAKTKKEAKELLLAYASRHETVNEDAFISFTEDLDMDLIKEFIAIPDISIIQPVITADLDKLGGIEFNEDLTDGLSLQIKYKVSIPEESAETFEEELSDLLSRFPEATLEKKV